MDVTSLAVGFFSDVVGHFTNMPVKETVIFDIAFILIISAVFAFLARILRQPLIPAYVITGLLIGPLFWGFVKNSQIVYAFSEIGIAFLLFSAGLEISFKKIREVGLGKIVIIGILQIVAIFAISYLSAGFFHLTALQAAYIGIILSFGSTMVVVKLLADSHELVTLHGRLILGILLLQDLVAIVAIVVFTTGGFSFGPISIALGKLVLMVVIALLLQKIVLRGLFSFAARSTELLFLSSLAVLFLFIVMSYALDLSIVIGAFIAGVSLANSPFKQELESKISPLRDFFAILFFVSLGMQVVFSGVRENMGLFWFLIIGSLVIKTLITFILTRATGYRSRTSFMTSISLAQLSEFSLIIGMLGVSLGAIDVGILSTVILATVITMALTPYLVTYKNGLFNIFKYPLRLFNFLPVKEHLEFVDKNEKHILLVGAHRMGSVLIKHLLENTGDRHNLLVIDYNPEIIKALIKKNISAIYGDLGGAEILNKVHMGKMKIIISTIPSFDDNLSLLKRVKQTNSKATIILTAERISEATELYNAGADYVIMPKILAGDEVLDLIHKPKNEIKSDRIKQLKKLNEIHRLLY